MSKRERMADISLPSPVGTQLLVDVVKGAEIVLTQDDDPGQPYEYSSMIQADMM